MCRASTSAQYILEQDAAINFAMQNYINHWKRRQGLYGAFRNFVEEIAFTLRYKFRFPNLDVILVLKLMWFGYTCYIGSILPYWKLYCLMALLMLCLSEKIREKDEEMGNNLSHSGFP
jgi:hypothetical protein